MSSKFYAAVALMDEHEPELRHIALISRKGAQRVRYVLCEFTTSQQVSFFSLIGSVTDDLPTCLVCLGEAPSAWVVESKKVLYDY